MATTRVVLLERLSEAIGDWWSDTTTSGGSTTTLIDTSLLNHPMGGDADGFIDWYVRITSGDADGESRRVSAYSESTGTLTVQSAFSATIATSVTYELHRFDPVDKHNALNAAGRALYPSLSVPLIDETLVVDDLLSNSDFESAIVGGAHPNWTNFGTPATVSAETNRVWHGSQAALYTASGSAVGGAQQVLQDGSSTFLNYHEIVNKSILFARRVWCATADSARIGISLDNGSSFTYSDYHDGTEDWQRLQATVSIADPSTTAGDLDILCRLEVAISQTAIFDGGGNSGAFIDPIYRYTLPTTYIRAPNAIRIQGLADHPSGPFRGLILGERPIRGRVMQVTGRGLLTQPSTDAATMEINDPEVDLLIARAAQWLSSMMSRPARAGVDQSSGYKMDANDWALEVARIKQENILTQPRHEGAQRRKGIWHTEWNSSGVGTVVFDAMRAG